MKRFLGPAFDFGAPMVAYYALIWSGVGTVTALVVAAAIPALAVAYAASGTGGSTRRRVLAGHGLVGVWRPHHGRPPSVRQGRAFTFAAGVCVPRHGPQPRAHLTRVVRPR